MTQLTLPQALGELLHIPQWFVWRLDWNEKKAKYDKRPVAVGASGVLYDHDSGDSKYWRTYHAAVELRDRLALSHPQHRYTLGWRLTPNCGYWFLDMDEHVRAGTYSPLALEWWAKLPGVFMEFSTSDRGLHFIGRGALPPHSCKHAATQTELYTQDRGIAFGFSGQAWGSADTPAAGILEIAASHFAPSVAVSAPGAWRTARADWAGPADDDELLAIAMRSHGLLVRSGASASFSQLWNNAPELRQFYGDSSDPTASIGSDVDAALAQHLAFWTGCDAPRIERMMRRSALARPKWDEHRTYLQMTINRACSLQGDVYCKPTAEQVLLRPAALPPRSVPPPPSPLPLVQPLAVLDAEPAPQVVEANVSQEQMEQLERACDLITSAGSIDDVYNRIIPSIKRMGIAPALAGRLITLTNRTLSKWDAKLRVSELRALMGVSATVAAESGASPALAEGAAPRPAWADDYVYLAAQDAFLDRLSGAVYKPGAMHRMLARRAEVPLNSTGSKYDVAELLTEQWEVEQAHDTFYHALYPNKFMFDGKIWWNTYNPLTVPLAAVAYTGAANDGISRFLAHIWRICGGVDADAHTLMHWIAHQVQRPGHKVMWAPLIVGFEGAGKTLIAKLLRKTMGDANVKVVSSSSLSNSGGFTDWANGKAVTVMEEIYIAGPRRHEILNMIKEPISNDVISINRKGKTELEIPNGSNYIAFSNHHDAAPIADAKLDRRWFVKFVPYAELSDLLADAGADSDTAYFDPIFDSIDAHSGEWRKWLMEWKLPEDFPPRRAPFTQDKVRMVHTSKDEVESELRSVIEEGGHGVCAKVFSARCLTNLLRSKGAEPPKTTSAHHIFSRMGYVGSGQIWWDGASHRVWAKSGVSPEPDNLRQLLEKTRVTMAIVAAEPPHPK